jgi:steroid delta-isomerase-like uncharacterized protein
MPIDMKAMVQRLVDAYSSPKLDGFDSILTDDVVLVRDDEKAHGRDEFKAVLTRVKQAFPDIQYRIDEVITTSDRIVLRWEALATHRDEYLGVPASGRAISYTGITIYELRGDRIARVWVNADLLTLLRRLREPRLGAPAPQARA